MIAAQQNDLNPRNGARAKPDRRRHHRVDIALGGRFMYDDADHSLETVNVSCGGARLRAQVSPANGETVICYFDDLGRVSGTVARQLDDGFAIHFQTSAHKRDKLADRLIWLINHKRYGLQDQRSAPRKAKGGPALITRTDGTRIQCRVIDISMTGAAFEFDGPPPIVGERVRAGTIIGEVVRSVTGEFAIRFLALKKAD